MTPYQEGFRAYGRGEPITENPYPDYTQAHGYWNDGWREHERHQKDKDDALDSIGCALRMLPPRIVVSYADTKFGHIGYIYRASNFNYAGWTDMERKTPRYDYLAPGKHTRDAFRNGAGAQSVKVRRKPKHKYWTTTGDRRERKRLAKLCGWPLLSWKPHEV